MVSDVSVINRRDIGTLISIRLEVDDVAAFLRLAGAARQALPPLCARRRSGSTWIDERKANPFEVLLIARSERRASSSASSDAATRSNGSTRPEKSRSSMPDTLRANC